MNRFITLALLALTVLVGSLPTSATASGGITRIKNETCYDTDTHKICISIDGFMVNTETPSDNIIATGQITHTTTILDYNGNIVSDVTAQNQTVRVFKSEDDLQVQSDRITGTGTLADGTVCTYAFTLHYANGEYQFDRVDYECH